jgi:hypothetical protein
MNAAEKASGKSWIRRKSKINISLTSFSYFFTFAQGIHSGDFKAPSIETRLRISFVDAFVYRRSLLQLRLHKKLKMNSRRI